MMPRIVVTGVAVIDFVFTMDTMPRRPDKYRASDAIIVGGGCAANAAVAIARLGGEAILATRLGDDSMADLILSELQAENVDTTIVHQAKNGRSSFSSVYVDQHGERQIMNYQGDNLIQETDWLDAAPRADAILADNRWAEGTAKMMAMARKRDIPGIVDAEDPIDPTVLQDATHVAFSRQGLTALTGEEDLGKALKIAAALLPSWLCVTDGEMGAYFIQNGKVDHIPAFGVDAKDTLGAGDIWHGAFVLQLAEGASEANAIEFANAAAAIKCTQHGGRTGSPDRNTTNSFLMERK